LPFVLLINVVVVHWRNDMARTTQVVPLGAHSLRIYTNTVRVAQ